MACLEEEDCGVVDGTSLPVDTDMAQGDSNALDMDTDGAVGAGTAGAGKADDMGRGS